MDGRSGPQDAEAPDADAFSPARYNIVWDTPSKDQSGSMPLGNGSTGVNAWIEPNGDLLFYISRTDSWGGNDRLLKLGRVRIALDPAPATDDFLQTLSLEDGSLKASCGETDIRLWVDANHPVIHAEINGPKSTTATAEEWLAGMDQVIANVATKSFKARRAAHEAWWKNFWQRSWIHVTPGSAKIAKKSLVPALYSEIKNSANWTVNPAMTAELWVRQDVLGSMRILDKTMPGSNEGFLLDTHPRNSLRLIIGDGCFTANNCLKTGQWHHVALVVDANAGRVELYLDGKQVAGRKHAGELEESFVVSRAYALQRYIIPFANEVLIFFDQQYKTGADGKLVMHPSQALETWWECTNPMPEVAGLHAVTDRLLALPEKLTDPKMRTYWTKLKGKIPDLPTREVKGVKMLAPAAKFAKCKNSEVPKLYAVYPFRLSSFEQENAKLGIEALQNRGPKGYQGWRQDDIFMAYLGLTDQTHGGVLMKAIQSMLLQTDGKKIYLLPAWPKDWNVDFKFHAPYQTIVEGRVKNGKIIDFKVTPKSRKKDVVIGQE